MFLTLWKFTSIVNDWIMNYDQTISFHPQLQIRIKKRNPTKTEIYVNQLNQLCIKGIIRTHLNRLFF